MTSWWPTLSEQSGGWSALCFRQMQDGTRCGSQGSILIGIIGTKGEE